MLELPTSPLGEIPGDSDIWEANDGGAHFKMTRHQLPLGSSGLDFFSLSISGEPIERRRVISDFCAVLGEPDQAETSTENHHIDILGWMVRRDAVR
ncbi:hypothetical protein HY441_02060 [Candidatus Microgenomates bacterium]|nr:hypothetical protein [Candidatus Microgenomates bacterium]